MAEKNNATCSICGKAYHMCASCKDEMSLTPWKMHTDTVEHFKIYQVIHGHSTGVYTKNEAKAKLKNVDLSDIDSLRDNIREILKDILGEDKKSKKAKAVKDESVFPKTPAFPAMETLSKEEALVHVKDITEDVEAVVAESVAHGETV